MCAAGTQRVACIQISSMDTGTWAAVAEAQLYGYSSALS